jgi:hypothetical protein
MLHADDALLIYFPVPVTEKIVGLLLALLLTVTVAPAAPTDLGTKTTITLHVPLGPTGPLQLVLPPNSLDPAIDAPLKVIVAPPFFFAVLVTVITLVLVFGNLTLPKFSEP